MSIDLSSETVVTLTNATKTLPPRRGGKRPHPSTLFRWAKDGLGGIKLDTIQVGGTMCTSLEALQRFFEKLSRANGDSKAPATLRTSAQRNRADDLAAAELDRMGV